MPLAEGRSPYAVPKEAAFRPASHDSHLQPSRLRPVGIPLAADGVRRDEISVAGSVCRDWLSWPPRRLVWCWTGCGRRVPRGAFEVGQHEVVTAWDVPLPAVLDVIEAARLGHAPRRLLGYDAIGPGMAQKWPLESGTDVLGDRRPPCLVHHEPERQLMSGQYAPRREAQAEPDPSALSGGQRSDRCAGHRRRTYESACGVSPRQQPNLPMTRC